MVIDRLITCLEKTPFFLTIDGRTSTTKKIVEDLKTSIHFDFGTIDGLEFVFDNTKTLDCNYYFSDSRSIQHLPFEKMTVCFAGGTFKGCIFSPMVVYLIESEGEICAVPFIEEKSVKDFIFGTAYTINDKRVEKIAGVGQVTQWHFIAGVEEMCKDDQRLGTRYRELTNCSLLMANLAILLLECKNVGKDKINPNKSSKRRNGEKKELLSYYTLKLLPFSQKEKAIPKFLWNNRLHLARGHFKHYGPSFDPPRGLLFGKREGRFWHQPQLRGNDKSGVIFKDYDGDGLKPK